MLVFEFKAYGKSAQLIAVSDAIRTAKVHNIIRHAKERQIYNFLK
jgi:hypothetical protein